MTDVAGIRNARVVNVRRHGADAGFGFIYCDRPAPRHCRASGRSYSNRTVPLPKPAAAPKIYRTGGMKIKMGGVTFGGVDITSWRAPPKATERPSDALPIETGSQVSLRLFDFKVVSIHVSRSWSGHTIDVDFTVPERNTGNPLTLTYHHAILPSTEKHYLAEQAGIALTKAFEHEVRERLYLGAKPFVDPHPETRADHNF